MCMVGNVAATVVAVIVTAMTVAAAIVIAAAAIVIVVAVTVIVVAATVIAVAAIVVIGKRYDGLYLKREVQFSCLSKLGKLSWSMALCAAMIASPSEKGNIPSFTNSKENSACACPHHATEVQCRYLLHPCT